MEMKKAAERNFTVEYYEKGEALWVLETRLNAPQHEIEMCVEINMEEMLVVEASIRFLRSPLEHCPLIEKKASMLKGLKVDNEFIRNAMKVFMGPEGCPNIMSLLNVSVPGILYFYYPYRIKTGAMREEEFDHIIRTDLKNACLAHTMMDDVL